MQKQKLKIQYQKDQSVHQIRSAVQQKKINPSAISFDLQNAHLAKRNKFQSRTKQLQKIIFRYKVNKLTTTFVKKMRLNSTYRKPVQFNDQNIQNQSSNNSYFLEIRQYLVNISNQNGIDISNIGLIIWSVINILQITLMVFIFSIMVTFPQTQNNKLFLYFRMFSIFLYIIDMVLNFIVKRYEGTKHLQKINQISLYYVKNGFFVDLISILIFPIDILVGEHTNITILISFVALIKLVNNIKKFQKFEYLLITNSQKQQYYGLVKVFITNFVIGHFLSIFLNLMTYIDGTQAAIDSVSSNWRVKFGIQHTQWYVKYVWGYYWGTNIMLTVGFGDISATNYYEAILLVFIETISCITLAYNINYVGAIINSMKSGEQLKKKKLKTFHRMCKQNFVPNSMESKITNFIEQSFRIKQSFQYDAHDQVLKSLPKILQRDYRKQANKTLFINLGFLSNLSKKTLLKLAQEISRRICHPEQTVLRKGSVYDFMILQKGSLSLTCRVNSILDGKEIQTIQVKQGQKPKILSLDFIKNKVLNYNIKSDAYSVLYYLSRQDFMQVLKVSDMDYQLFCVLKDSDNKQIDQNNLYNCSVCKSQFHNKFQCNRLHFIPLKRLIICRYLRQVSKQRQDRNQKIKRKNMKISSLKCGQSLKQDQRRYIQDHFDIELYEQIQQLRQFYNKIYNKNILQNTCVTQGNFFKSSKTTCNDFMQNTKTNLRGLLDEKFIVKMQEMFQNRAYKSNAFWQFQVDEAHNFIYYFREGNPESFKRTKKSKRSKEIFKLYF